MDKELYTQLDEIEVVNWGTAREEVAPVTLVKHYPKPEDPAGDAILGLGMVLLVVLGFALVAAMVNQAERGVKMVKQHRTEKQAADLQAEREAVRAESRAAWRKRWASIKGGAD